MRIGFPAAVLALPFPVFSASWGFRRPTPFFFRGRGEAPPRQAASVQLVFWLLAVVVARRSVFQLTAARFVLSVLAKRIDMDDNSCLAVLMGDTFFSKEKNTPISVPCSYH
jgi:hypothetical protein